ncbi:unnamed protein product [Didymodactylos carnosus]|uniref:Rhomboid protein n=1 Tax=Didymodactylos carnosus TaxID=1234261 RepID=A0A8S2I433_9BILA|nr:unnamed protein product [Didymodactylos carnosus]CAF3709380.1 unnamed protein product [Didymodactylos carnosus]
MESSTYSQCVHVLAVIPGKIMPPNFWIWTLLTHSFIELHIWHTCIDVIVVFLYSKMIEPLWGTKELLSFYFLVTIPNAIFATCIYFMIYMFTFNDEYLFERPIYGLASFIGAYCVVIKQIMPDTVIISTPFIKLKQDHVPLLIILISTLLYVINAVPVHFLIMLSFGIFISWTYLRFFQLHKNGSRGDQSNTFSFASFFPPPIQPVISVLANTVFELFVRIKICKPFVKKYNVAAPSSITITIPGAEAADADRRSTHTFSTFFLLRQKALKALDDRLKQSSEAWPDIDESTTTNTAAQTHQIHSTTNPSNSQNNLMTSTTNNNTTSNANNATTIDLNNSTSNNNQEYHEQTTTTQ